MSVAPGVLLVFEGLDQSGKQTQAERLRDALTAQGRAVLLASFPDYTTAIGQEIEAGLRGRRDYTPDVMQLLYVANRYEWKPQIDRHIAAGGIVVCDRYRASSVAYGEAFGLDPAWLQSMQQYLPTPALTVLLDIDPATAVQRKAADRDRFERDLALQQRVRESYRRQAAAEGWLVLDGERDRALVAADVLTRVAALLASR